MNEFTQFLVRNTVEDGSNCPVFMAGANSPVMAGLYLFQVSFDPHAPRVRVIMEAEGNLRVIDINNSTDITSRRVVFEVGPPGVINCLSLYFLSGLFSEYLLGYCRFNVGIRIAFSSIYSLFNCRNGPPQDNVLGK
jgi:hypothetical protein